MDHTAPSRRADWRMAILTILLALVLHTPLATRQGGVIDTGRLPDTDAYTRTMRVERLYDTGAWFDTTLPQLNAPEGLSSHWTRPLDVLILIPALAVIHTTSIPPRTAIFWSGAAISPLLHLLCALAAAWAARALIPTLASWAAAAAILLNPVLLFAYGAFGQTDHHMLVLLAVLIALGAALRALQAPQNSKPAHAAGLALGCGIWASPETLLVAAPLLATFGIAWIFQPATPGHHAAQTGARIAFAMWVVTFGALAIEHPPHRWFATEYDKLSVHHSNIALFAFWSFSILAAVSSWLPARHAALARLAALPPRLAIPARLAIAAAVAALAAAALLAAYPEALRASEAAADRSAATLFLPHVAEMAPLRPTLAGAHDLLLYTGGLIALLALPPLARRTPWPATLLLALTLATILPATLLHRRFAVDLAAVTALLTAAFVALAAARSPRPILPAAALTLALVAPFTGLAFPADAARQRETQACDWNAFATWFAAAPLAPATILTDHWRATPELAWRTPHRYIVSPYHRAGTAFQDTHDAMSATQDTPARAILARRAATYILLCTAQRPPNLGPPNPASLEQRLRSDAPPPWLSPVPLPPALAAFRLLRVE
jgi:hypothetical protein